LYRHIDDIYSFTDFLLRIVRSRRYSKALGDKGIYVQIWISGPYGKDDKSSVQVMDFYHPYYLAS
jgi:hypothetical protein